jgi:hypothetical protein
MGVWHFLNKFCYALIIWVQYRTAINAVLVVVVEEYAIQKIWVRRSKIHLAEFLRECVKLCYKLQLL